MGLSGISCYRNGVLLKAEVQEEGERKTENVVDEGWVKVFGRARRMRGCRSG